MDVAAVRARSLGRPHRTVPDDRHADRSPTPAQRTCATAPVSHSAAVPRCATLAGVDVQDLLQEAVRGSGLEDVGDEWFLGPLGAWATDLEQDNLTDFGRKFFRSLAVRDVARRQRVLDTLSRYPEIAEVPIPPIVYVTGQERSGTTLLHNLLAQHSRGRALLRWELMEPSPPPTAATYATDPRIRSVQDSIDKLRGSFLERMHWVNADEPEECVWGVIDATSMLGQAAGLCMPEWSRALEQDQTRVFENYRRVVQMLLWRNPVEAGGFLVLKAPQIGRHIETFSTVFPEARFVITDRDPYRCITSVAAMVESIIDPFCVENPMTDDGHRDQRAAGLMIPKLAALSSFTATAPDRAIHVAYPTLIRDPAGTVRHIFDQLGIPVAESLDADLGRFLEQQRAGKRVAPPSELPTLGYEHDDVSNIAVIADYCEQFGIAPERTRLTSTS
jgi:hypothetical protein